MPPERALIEKECARTAFLIGVPTAISFECVQVGNLVICIHCKGLPKKLTDYMFISDDYGGRREDNYYSTLSTMEDVSRTSLELASFARTQNLPEDKVMKISLFAEEFGSNIIRHGQPKSGNGVCADLRVHVSDGQVSMSIRDYCESFDPVWYYESHKDEMNENHLGILIVMQEATEVRYVNALNSNSVLIGL